MDILDSTITQLESKDLDRFSPPKLSMPVDWYQELIRISSVV
uniref:Uncharacterized protein n=1 Tax=Arundo donax TaxID=35708 RepID=A0A0A9B8C1_ARUDO